MIQARKRMFGGDSATVKEVSPDSFSISTSNTWTVPTPENETPEEFVERNNKQSPRMGRGSQMSWSVAEENGVNVVKQSFSRTEHFRIRESLLFSAGFEELHEMDLPTMDSLMTQVSSDNDMGMEWNFDRIPAGIKQLAWGMLSGGAGVQMQQRDEEAEAIANLRKSGIQFGLDVVKAVMFDVSEANGWLKFAGEQDQSIRGELNFATRRNSQLTEQLVELSSGRSRFSPLLHDEAPATLHLCVQAFQDDNSLPIAAGEWLKHMLAEATANQSEAVQAADQVAQTLSGIGDHGTLEAFVKAGWTEASGGVIYAGLQVDDNPNLLRSLQTLALMDDGIAQNGLELIQKDGQDVLQFVLPEVVTQWIAEQTSLQLTHVSLTHQNSCLWLAVGQEDAWELLQQSIDRCSDTGLAVKAPLFTAKLDVERWLQLPEDDPVGVGNLLRWLDANQRAFPPGPMSISFGGQKPDEKPTALLVPVMELGGDRNAEFTVLADRSGLRVSLSLGEAIANYYVARMIDMQDRQFSRVNQEREKAAAAAKAAASTKPK
ncbi:MAG: hypothetical protein R3C59_28205 [Planctomycetaceae bacterium]